MVLEAEAGNILMSEMVRLMAENTRLDGRITNHSLRKTTATRPYEKKIEDEVIKTTTVRRARKALRPTKSLAKEQWSKP